MTRVLVVASTFPASDSDSVPAFVKDQIKAMKLVDDSLKFSVLAPHDTRSNTQNYTKHDTYDEYRFHYAWPRSIEKLAGKGIMPTLQANPLLYLLIPGLFFYESVALYRLIRRLKPDLVYAHWFTPQVVTTRIVGALTNTPFVFTTHASDVSVWRKVPLIGTPIVRWATKSARSFTAVSERSMNKLAAFFEADEWQQLKKRSRIIPMGVDLPSRQVTTDITNTNILFIGRLAEKKGVQYLLPAFKEVIKHTSEAKLTIAGDGPWLSRLQKQANELGLPVEFPGYITGQAKRQLIDSHAIYVVPSIITSSGDAEGLPVSLMEGLAAGKLCIATNESGADNILNNGKDGLLIPEKDVKALASALQQTILLSNSDKLEQSRNAQETAKQFSWPVIAKAHINFLFKDIA